MTRRFYLVVLMLVLMTSIFCKKEKEFLPFEFVMGTNVYTPSNMGIPDKGEKYQDPNFLTTCQRITEKSDGYSGPGIENEYARSDPENANGTRLILRGNDGAYYLYNRETCEMIGQIAVFSQCSWEEPEPRWDNTDPNVFYYLCNTELRSYNISTGNSATLHDFKNDFPLATSITTNVEGDASLDRRYWAFIVQDSNYNFISLIVYDRVNDSIVGQKSTGFPDEFNWCSIDMSGSHCLVGYESINYVQVFSLDLSTSIDLPAGSNAHGDLAYTNTGEDVFVYQNTATDHISMADLNTGTEVQLISIPFDVNIDIGLHISGNCAETPGWVLISTYGSYNPPSGSSHSWMDCQLFMLELKANPRIWRIAHTQSYTSQDYTGEKNYFAEAFASINTTGTRIYWGSNWRNYTMDYTDAYVVLLEDDWVNKMPAQ